jgi:hypothetical protein
MVKRAREEGIPIRPCANPYKHPSHRYERFSGGATYPSQCPGAGRGAH